MTALLAHWEGEHGGIPAVRYEPEPVVYPVPVWRGRTGWRVVEEAAG